MAQPSQFIQGLMNELAPMANVNALGNVGGGNRMDPAHNNMPLSFNTGKNKPPMARSTSEYDENNPQVSEEAPSSTTAEVLMQQPHHQAGAMMPGGGDMFGMGYGGPMGYSGADPSMMMMGPIMNQYGMNMMGPMQGAMPNYAEREVITLKSCVLYPPPPGAPPRSVRERPMGCRTAFVGGLPENINEDILVEVFEKCGNIVSIRLSKKQFAHIRFEFPDSVENALFISGYRMKIENKDDKKNTGRIHVDYAMARDDQYEFECQQRAIMREMRHQQRMEEERLRPPSPPPPVVFSEHEATLLIERLKGDDDFMNASEVLVSWLEKGDCNRRTNASFYSMIQSINSHVRRLVNEKQKIEEEVERIKKQAQFRFQDILRQFDQIVRVFGMATKQRAWDHFTKAQRKNIDAWSKQAEDVRKTQQDEFLGSRQEDEMEMVSDDEGEAAATNKKRKVETSESIVDTFALNNLKDENDTLKCQMEGYKNEVDLVKQESLNSLEAKDKQMKALQNALQGMQQQLIAAKQQQKEKEKLLEEARARKSSSDDSKEQSSEDKDSEEINDSNKKTDSPEASAELNIPETLNLRKTESTVSSSGINLSSKEAKMLGASIDYLWSYLNQMVSCRPREIEDLMEKLPMLFREEVQGVGARLERRWVFTAYQNSAPSMSTNL